jgi:hypothetical protein
MVAQGIQEKEGVDISQLLGLVFAENLGQHTSPGVGRFRNLASVGRMRFRSPAETTETSRKLGYIVVRLEI